MNKEHDLFGSPTTDDVKIYLSNTAPSASADHVKADLAEIATGNGYTGPIEPANCNGTRSGGTYTLAGDQVTFTASGGAIAQFRYVVLMNDTHASDALIGWWDYGSAVDLADGESFTVKFNNQASGGTIFTLA